MTWRWKHLTPFYCIIISLRQIFIETKWLHIAYYCLLMMYNFNSYALSCFCDRNISLIIFEPEKWPKLWLKVLFYCVIISLRQLCIEWDLRQSCRVLKCLSDAANICVYLFIKFNGGTYVRKIRNSLNCNTITRLRLT